MKKVSLLVCLLVLLSAAVKLSSQRDLSEPPGKLEIAKHPLILEPPSGPQPRKIDLSKLRQESLDLAQLAQSVPAAADQAGQGKLPKDLSNKLKQIEKLSKRLRNELNPLAASRIRPSIRSLATADNVPFPSQSSSATMLESLFR